MTRMNTHVGSCTHDSHERCMENCLRKLKFGFGHQSLQDHGLIYPLLQRPSR